MPVDVPAGRVAGATRTLCSEDASRIDLLDARRRLSPSGLIDPTRSHRRHRLAHTSRRLRRAGRPGASSGLSGDAADVISGDIYVGTIEVARFADDLAHCKMIGTGWVAGAQTFEAGQLAVFEER
jgi:hypothetical protein